ncbi:PD-(D/E)XK nuclease family protein [Sphingomonas sp. LHG3406-1]|uniref:PD-(D/E)XK nuclease family protein n=1 Tax=Sphingomonas sp. LHG3406-1 TaxID=2804617 RepID=UPI002614E41D|nr:PD-(D/E)XK nuclease family protein [Sphingomonas sp. LHG3406-1]
MKLVFGMACDSSCYPDFQGGIEGVFGAAVVGPLGLLSAVEVQLGLTRPPASQAARVACYAAKLRAALEAQPDLFFAQSVTIDPWATAATLLQWRDELVAGGWTIAAAGPQRPGALALVERSGAKLPDGVADRLQNVCRALEAGPSLSIQVLHLIEALEILPPHWRTLIEKLCRCGVAVMEPQAEGQVAAGDLGLLQHFMAAGTTGQLQGDGSFVHVKSDTALSGAEAIAEWLSHGTEEELQGTVVISEDGDTALLDLALEARGLPALGQSVASPWRGALQVLPLSFAAAWAPFNAKALLDLLMLPRPPIPRKQARKLAYALSREPGTGGARWANAWAEIEADLDARVAGGELTRTDANRRLASWREWTSGSNYARTEGMPASRARAIATRVGQWALQLDAGKDDPLLLSVARAARGLAEAIDMLGLETLPALLLERMLDQVLADGAKNPAHIPKAGGLRCVRSPAAIWSEAPRVIWWDFKGPGEKAPPSPWTNAEVSALAADGCHLEEPATFARRTALAHANAVRRAGERLLVVTPALCGGEHTTSHPLAHQLEPMVAPVRDRVTWRAEHLFEAESLLLAGRDLRRERLSPTTPPQERAAWRLPEAARARLAARVESATSFERLLDCQMRWMLLEVFRLSRSRVAEIPGPDQLLGNLAHEIANSVLRPGAPGDPTAILAEAQAEFERVLGAIATPLQQPEYAGELAAARSRVPQALSKLAGMLGEMGVEIVGTELERSRDFGQGLSVGGRLDLVVRHPVHGLGVIDLKWSRSANRRRTEIAEGRAVQLATYGAIADHVGSGRAQGAYYLLNQRRLLGFVGSFLADEAVESEQSLEDTWTAMVTTWRSWRDLAQRGDLVATGAKAAEVHFPADLPLTPGKEPCQYCELTGLCRVAAEAI